MRKIRPTFVEPTLKALGGTPKRRGWVASAVAVVVIATAVVLAVGVEGGSGSRSGVALAAGEEAQHVGPSLSWPAYGNDVEGQRYSPATQVSEANVSGLKLAFTAHIDIPGLTKTGAGVEENPIEENNVIYAVSDDSPNTVGAYNATTGAPIWQKSYVELVGVASTGGTDTHGLAMGDGKIFVDLGPEQPVGVEESGGVLVALNQATGDLEWKVDADQETESKSSSMPAPTYYEGMVYVGMSGTSSLHGSEGKFEAFDADTGQLVWTFHSDPKIGEPAARTWGSGPHLAEFLEHGGGATWTVSTIEPKLGLIYVQVGNPGSYQDGLFRHFGTEAIGKELYTDSLVALNAKTGKVVWYFQAVHHDEWDYDCINPAVQWNQMIKGKMVHGIDFGCKDGYVYALDRENGKPVWPVKEVPLSNAKTDPEAKKEMEELGFQLEDHKPMKENVSTGALAELVPHCADSALLPAVSPNGSTWKGEPFEDTCAFPYYSQNHFVTKNEESVDWEPPSYDPKLGYIYYCTNRGIIEMGLTGLTSIRTATDGLSYFPEFYNNGREGEPRQGIFTAVNISNDTIAWQRVYEGTDQCESGSSTTDGGLVFTADSEGNLYALDASTGTVLWEYSNSSVTFKAPPIVYEAEGTEYLAISATLKTSTGTEAVLLAFSLNGQSAPPTTTTPTVTGAGGESIFLSNCGSCHTLAAAGTTGTTGPNLDELKPSEETVEKQVISGGGGMPSFQGVLSTAQIKEVATYVSEVAGKK